MANAGDGSSGKSSACRVSEGEILWSVDLPPWTPQICGFAFPKSTWPNHSPTQVPTSVPAPPIRAAAPATAFSFRNGIDATVSKALSGGQKTGLPLSGWSVATRWGGRLQCEERAGFRQSGRVLASCWWRSHLRTL